MSGSFSPHVSAFKWPKRAACIKGVRPAMVRRPSRRNLQIYQKFPRSLRCFLRLFFSYNIIPSNKNLSKKNTGKLLSSSLFTASNKTSLHFPSPRHLSSPHRPALLGEKTLAPVTIGPRSYLSMTTSERLGGFLLT